MSRGIASLRGYQEGGFLEWLKKLGGRVGGVINPPPLPATDLTSERFGGLLPSDDPRIEEMQPLIDSLQLMLPPPPPPPHQGGNRGFRRTRFPPSPPEVPVYFRDQPRTTLGGSYIMPQWDRSNWPHAWATHYIPEHINLYPEGIISILSDLRARDQLRHTLIHEFGHAYDERDAPVTRFPGLPFVTKDRTGIMSPEIRADIRASRPPFDIPGTRYADAHASRGGLTPTRERFADFFADAFDFLQVSKDPEINQAYLWERLDKTPHRKRVVGELLNHPLYENHPLNIAGPPQDRPDLDEPGFWWNEDPRLRSEPESEDRLSPFELRDQLERDLEEAFRDEPWYDPSGRSR